MQTALSHIAHPPKPVGTPGGRRPRLLSMQPLHPGCYPTHGWYWLSVCWVKPELKSDLNSVFFFN